MNEPKPIIETLIERDRLRGATRMFIEGTDASAVSEEKAKAVIHEVEVYLKTSKLSRKALARDVGYSAGVISEVLASTYRGDWRGVILDLDRWLDQQRRRDEAPRTSQFVWTEVAREIQTVASLVTQMRAIGLVYGPDTSGIGKTMALQAIYQETPGSLFVTCDKIEANPTGLLRAIARELRISDGQSNRSIYARVKGILRNTSRLLIVDQIHNLRKAKDDKPLYILTDLWDATKSPQLWCGTADMVAYLERGRARGDESLAQIRRRIVYVRDLLQRCRDPKSGGRGEPLVSVQSIREMFAKNKIRLTPAAVRWLYELASIPDSGALGTAVNLVTIATITAEQRGMKEIDVPLLAAALRDSVQSETFARLTAEIEAEPARRMAAAG